MNAIAHNHIKPPRLTKQGFVAGGAAAVADELGGDQLGGAAEKSVGEVLDGRGGYGGGLGDGRQLPRGDQICRSCIPIQGMTGVRFS